MIAQGKSYYQLERIIKGAANHRRIEILELLKNIPELSVIDISEKLEVNFKTVSEHIKRLATAGFVIKRSDGASVRHKITPRGIAILKFLRTLE
ncbi:MAG: winged helix-turn-helix domain-containing protein [Candidatus Staskawiczbacteria bacterium]|nr:winged helix-turn-helix domain-containing protein [Candidatus Staskawiczbacteria bacterium]